jgi:hypothetical protein
MNTFTKEDLLKTTHLTVGRLKEFIEKNNVPDDAIVMIERVEDAYYEGFDISGMMGVDGIYPPGSKAEGWRVYLKEGEMYHNCIEHNRKIDSGEFLDKTEYPDIEEGDDVLKKIPVEDLEQFKTQYSPAWSCVDYKEKEFLFIDLHY